MKCFYLALSSLFCFSLQAMPQAGAEEDSVHVRRDGHPAWRVRRNIRMVNDTLIVDFSKSESDSQDISSGGAIGEVVETVPDSGFTGVKAMSFDEMGKSGWMIAEHNQVNHNPLAVFFNGNFVKSTIGFDGFFLRRANRNLMREPFVHAGHSYRGKLELSSPQYDPELTSLRALYDRHASPRPLSACLFVVDGVLLTDGLDDFCFDEGYIDSVEVVDINGGLPVSQWGDSLPVFSVVQIYTRGSRSKRGWTVSFEFPEQKALVLKPYSQHDVNRAEKQFFLNGKEIGTFVGIDVQALLASPDRRVALSDSTVRINSSGYVPRLVSLAEIGGSFPGSSAINPIFFVNDVLLIGDPESIRIDADYIQNVRLFSSTELEALDGGVVGWGRDAEPVSVIRIYTNDVESQRKAERYGRAR